MLLNDGVETAAEAGGMAICDLSNDGFCKAQCMGRGCHSQCGPALVQPLVLSPNWWTCMPLCQRNQSANFRSSSPWLKSV